jgi:hypothetical protein
LSWPFPAAMTIRSCLCTPGTTPADFWVWNVTWRYLRNRYSLQIAETRMDTWFIVIVKLKRCKEKTSTKLVPANLHATDGDKKEKKKLTHY